MFYDYYVIRTIRILIRVSIWSGDLSGLNEESLRVGAAVNSITEAERAALWVIRAVAQDGIAASTKIPQKLTVVSDVQASTLTERIFAIVRTGSIGGLALCAPAKPGVSEGEFDLLNLLGRIQHQNDYNELVNRLAVPTGEQFTTMVDVLMVLADFLFKANIVLPLPVANRPVLSAVGVRKCDKLAPSEQCLLAGVRLWAKSEDDWRGGMHILTNYFGRIGLGEVCAPLHTMLVHAVTSSTRGLFVNCPGFEGLTVDEARIIHAVSATQRGYKEIAMTLLATWLPPVAVRLSLRCIEGLSDILGAQSGRMPLRDWAFPELCDPESWRSPWSHLTNAIH